LESFATLDVAVLAEWHPSPVAQFVADKLLQASSRRRRHPKWYRLFKHQAEVEVAPL